MKMHGKPPEAAGICAGIGKVAIKAKRGTIRILVLGFKMYLREGETAMKYT
jgi:hypothetical protein